MEIDIHTAMLNSYRVIIQGQLPEDIISTELCMFALDPSEPVEKEVIKYKDNPLLKHPRVQNAIKHARRAGEL